LLQAPQAVVVGRVTAVAWPPQVALASTLAELADQPAPFPGIGALPPERPLRLVLAASRARFDSVTRGRLPPWAEGAALPDAGLVVLLSSGPPDQLARSLRHELAHLALRWYARRPLPLWLEEGYAARAAGEWDRLDALRLSWQLAWGRRLSLDDVDRALRGVRGDAAAAYGLATTAVLLLERWGGDSGLAPLLAAIAAGASFDDALRATFYVTAADFEERWQRDVGSRYGWLASAAAGGFAWSIFGVVLIALVLARRRRDRERRQRLETAVDEPPSA
jgi:hypothetical protein